MMALTFSLGLWQLDRAAQKEHLSQLRANAPALVLSGRWLPQLTVYLDHRQMQGKQGFFVITPLLLKNGGYVLVERGWIARNFLQRTELSPIETSHQPVTLQARTLPEFPEPLSFLGQGEEPEWPIVQAVHVDHFQKALPSQTYQGRVQQIGASSEGLLRNWDEPSAGVEKHYGYAFQWFALCTLTLLLYVWFQWIKKNKEQH